MRYNLLKISSYHRHKNLDQFHENEWIVRNNRATQNNNWKIIPLRSMDGPNDTNFGGPASGYKDTEFLLRCPYFMMIDLIPHNWLDDIFYKAGFQPNDQSKYGDRNITDENIDRVVAELLKIGSPISKQIAEELLKNK